MNHHHTLLVHGVMLMLLLLNVSAILTEEPLDEDVCRHIECPQILECPHDSHLKSNSEEVDDFDVDYEELPTSNPFSGVHIEALLPIQRTTAKPTTAKTSAAAAYTPHKVDQNESRRKRELMFAEPTDWHKLCCDDDEAQCVCKTCPEVPKCEDGNKVAVEISMGQNLPGNCCSTYKCIDAFQCTDEEGGEQEYWRNSCTKCRCIGGFELCNNQCPMNDDPRKHRHAASEEEKNCFSEYLQKPMVNGAVWFEDSYCSECSCSNGERSCFTSLCAAVECENPMKVKGKCCPVCAETEIVKGEVARNNDVEVPMEVDQEQSSSTLSTEKSTSTEAQINSTTTDTDSKVKEESSTESSTSSVESTSTAQTTLESTTAELTALPLATLLNFSSTEVPVDTTTASDEIVTSTPLDTTIVSISKPAASTEASTSTTANEGISSTENPTTYVPKSNSMSTLVTETSATVTDSTPPTQSSPSTVTSSTSSAFSTSTQDYESSSSSTTTSTSSPFADLDSPIISTDTESPLIASTSSIYSSTSITTSSPSNISPTMPSTTSAPPAPIDAPQPTSYRKSELALISNISDEDYNTISIQHNQPEMDNQHYSPEFWPIMLGCIFALVLVVFGLYVIANRIINKKKLYSTVPSAETSLTYGA